MDFDKLAADLFAAKASAQLAADTCGGDEGGACNFDAPTLRFPRMPHPRARAGIEAAAAKHGLTGTWEQRRGGARYVFGAFVSGQGLSRTRGAEAAQRHLAAAGWDVGMYYQAD